jgi:hypothetical protein
MSPFVQVSLEDMNGNVEKKEITKTADKRDFYFGIDGDPRT